MNQSAFIRTLPSVLIFLFGVGIAYFEYFDLSNSTEKDFRIRFNLDAGSRISAIKREVGFGLEAISAVRAFYASSHKVERNEFQNFSESLIAGQTTIQALEWIPRIKHDERAAYENLARMDGIVNFTIREKNELGKIVPASIRDEYFPIFFIAPVAGNETALGYDLASNPIRRNMLWRARDMNQMIASPPIQLVQDQNDDEISILVADPVYKNDIPVTDMAARRNHLIGFIVGAFHVRDLVQIALDYSGSAEIDFHLFDESSSDGTKLLYRYVSYPDHPETYRVTENTIYSLIDYHYSEQFSVADRVWRIVAIP